MKKAIILLVSLLCFGASPAQTINFELSVPAPQLQDADVGAMAFGDIDNDGDNDLMITGKGTPLQGPVKSTLYENDGSGNFTEVIGTPFENVFDGTVGFEDVDNDDDLDLLITGGTGSPSYTANLYKNDGAGNFTLVTGTPFEPSAGGDFAFGDVDNDGDPDLIMTGYSTSGTGFSKLYLNNGSGVFAEVAETAFEALRNSSVAFIDIDNDNDPDVLMAGTNINNEPSTTLYLNNGGGVFSLVANTPFENCASGDLAIADSDSDGDLDILISGQGVNNTIFSNLYLNDGTGTFSLFPGTPFPGTFAGATSFADFDNDGDFDVLLVGTGPGGLADNSIIANVYENQGANNYILADSLIGAYLSSSAIADVDGDNDPDLVIAGTSTGLPVRATRMYTNLTSNTVGFANDELSEEFQFITYPNPVNNNLNVAINNTTRQAGSFYIYNASGELVFRQNFSKACCRLSIDVADYPNGIYFINVNINDAQLTRSFVVEH